MKKHLIFFLLLTTAFACKKQDPVDQNTELDIVAKEFNLKRSTDKQLPITLSFKNAAELKAYLQNRNEKLRQSKNEPFLIDSKLLKARREDGTEILKPEMPLSSRANGKISAIPNRKSDQIYIEKFFNSGTTYFSVVVNSVYWSTAGFPDMLTVSWTLTPANNIIDPAMTSGFSYYKPGVYTLSNVLSIPPIYASDQPIALAGDYQEIYAVGTDVFINDYELIMYLSYFFDHPDYAWAHVQYIPS